MQWRRLATNFNIEQGKGIFPYKFADESYALDYVGEVPNISYFENITIEDYNKYCLTFNNNWSFKEQLLKYCELDCIVLHKVLNKFTYFMMDTFDIDISSSPTLSSLALYLYRSNYLQKKNRVYYSTAVQ